jgi:hypothetical protein
VWIRAEIPDYYSCQLSLLAVTSITVTISPSLLSNVNWEGYFSSQKYDQKDDKFIEVYEVIHIHLCALSPFAFAQKHLHLYASRDASIIKVTSTDWGIEVWFSTGKKFCFCRIHRLWGHSNFIANSYLLSAMSGDDELPSPKRPKTCGTCFFTRYRNARRQTCRHT